MNSGYLLGIDTGGTFTDGVLMEVQGRNIIKRAKTPTTHQNLVECIQKIIQLIRPEDPRTIKLVSISTTLATNAIAENKLRTAGLLLIGYDEELINRFGFQTQFSSTLFTILRGGHTLSGEEQNSLDEEGVVEKTAQLQDKVEAFAISGYFSPLNNSHELRAADLVYSRCRKPVVMGHQLSNQFDSIRRATTAAINASLLSISAEFISAVSQVLDKNGITAPLMIVRGDGGLMGSRYGQKKPVETIHSGPSASAIGGKFLSGLDNALVVDIGGTTTDMAVVEKGRVQVLDEGTTVEKFSTLVRSARVRSFGLGGDSWIHLDAEKQIAIGPQRVYPLVYFANRYPDVIKNLNLLDKINDRKIEYWFLLKNDDLITKNEQTQKILNLLQTSPMSVHDILRSMNLKDVRQLDCDDLFARNILGRAGLTPTDFLHYSKDVSLWDYQPIDHVLQRYSFGLGKSLEELNQEIRKLITVKLIIEILTFISGTKIDDSFFDLSFTTKSLGDWVVRESIFPSKSHLSCRFSLSLPIVGVGAPAHIFLPPVAEFFQTRLMLPENYDVANAAGAAAANILITYDGEVVVKVNHQKIEGYYARAGGEQILFETMDQAQDFLVVKLNQKAVQEAKEAGAKSPVVDVDIIDKTEQMVKVRVTAVGNPEIG